MPGGVGDGDGAGVSVVEAVGDGAEVTVAAAATVGVADAVSVGVAPQAARNTAAATMAAALMRRPPAWPVRVPRPQPSSASDWCSRSTIVSEWSAGYGGDVTNSTRAALSPAQANSMVSRGRDTTHSPASNSTLCV